MARDHGLLKRALIASVAIVLMTAGAVSAAVFLQVDEALDIFEESHGHDPPIVVPVDDAAPREPRTLMLLGSDARFGQKETEAHSDTILLVRFDARARATTVMSIPRDLRVAIPGYGTAKINQAFTQGGPELTLEVVRQVLSTAARPFEINHVVQVDFAGFRHIVDDLGCVYLDVDREYFNDVGGPGRFAVIDIDPGYQRLCGQDALDYARFRHTDSDLVRAVRQHEVIRQVLAQAATSGRFTIGRRDELAELAGRFIDVDASLRRRKTVLSIGKLLLATSGKPVQTIAFPVTGEVATDLLTSPAAVERAVSRFLHPARPPRARRVRRSESHRRKGSDPLSARMADSRRAGEDRAIVARRGAGFPVYYAARLPRSGRYAEAPVRTYRIRDRGGRSRRAYRMVIPLGAPGEYAGVQGMTWRTPPILAGPHDTIRVGRRRLHVYYDGRRVRLVAWRTVRAVYYVHNTLRRALNRAEMVAMASSLERPGH
jgi:polyisoprenyl-teichoic acid--peptidoglycan teichoic acid transferase